MTLPNSVRDELRLKPADEIEFMLAEDGGLRVVPVTASIMQLKRMVLKSGFRIGTEEVDEAIVTAVRPRLDSTRDHGKIGL